MKFRLKMLIVYFAGVNTCEACKGFYRRSIARKTPYSKCTGNGNCDIILTNRNACASCRLEKCVAVGMSKEGAF